MCTGLPKLMARRVAAARAPKRLWSGKRSLLSRRRRRDQEWPPRRQFYLVAWDETLIGDACTLQPINAVTSMLAFVGVEGVQHDVPILRTPEGIGLNATG